MPKTPLVGGHAWAKAYNMAYHAMVIAHDYKNLWGKYTWFECKHVLAIGSLILNLAPLGQS